MGLAKKPVLFLCNADAVTLRVSVPKTENHYLFYKGQAYLVKYDEDIEFFDDDLRFDRVDESKQPTSPEESAEDIVEAVDTPEENIESSEANEKEESPGGATQEDSDSVPKEKDSVPERQPYSKKELQKMRKTDVQDILKKLAPEKSNPVRKENIINAVLEAQGLSE